MMATVLATLVLELLILGAGIYYVGFSNAFLRDTAKRGISAMKPLVPYLGTPDPADLEEIIWEQTELPEGERGPEVSLRIAGDVDLLAVTDPEGRIVAFGPRRADQRKGESLLRSLNPQEREVFEAARQGATDAERIVRRTPDTRIITALPILDRKGNLLGVGFYRSLPLRAAGDVPWTLLSVILIGALLAAVGSGLVGICVGYLISRRLARRLTRVAGAADAWARGDFSARLDDREGDEITLLTVRLNRMARDLHDLLALRQDVATLEERNRLARDLHDTVKQQVFATAMQVSAARALLTREPDRAGEHLDEAQKLAHQAQKELTTLLRELRPVSAAGAADRSLTTILEGHLADWQRQTGIRAEFTAADPPRLPDTTAGALLRIAQEALANVARHSGASLVRVALEGGRDADSVTLSVRDDGRGFDTNAPGGGTGLGLHTMRERAEELPGGRFTLTSAPGIGTLVRVQATVLPEEKP